MMAYVSLIVVSCSCPLHLNIFNVNAHWHHRFNLISVSDPKGEQNEIWTTQNLQPSLKPENLLFSDQSTLESGQGRE